MTRPLRAGIALVAGAALVLLLSGLIGTEVQTVALLGLALGAALALVPGEGVGLRAAAFALGLVATWVTYAVRAAALPDAAIGRILAVVVAVVLCVVLATVTVGRLPLWALLLGAAAMAGAYETAYAANPSAVLSTSPTWATAVLVTAGLGFLTTALLAPPAAETDRAARRRTAESADAETTARGDDAVVPHPHAAPAQPAHAPSAAQSGATFPFQPQTEA